MTAERFRQVRNIFDAALEQPETSRAAWLAGACQGDELLRGEVDELLRQHAKRSGPLDAPADRFAELSGTRLEGSHLGHWEMLREIGRGGMGVVYLARRADGAFQMPAAVKVLNAPFAGADIQKRFRQEREILARLSHPNIARLLDGGTTPDGQPYLVMEFVNGQPLTDWCDERRCTTGERLELLEQLCQVVDYLHQNKVIHRDLKPANVLVDSSGNLKLLDFGISKLLGAPLGEQSLLATRSGLHLLTPEYASPEQVMGNAITPQTDIYALGVIAYELLSGHRPHRLRGQAINVMMRAICEDEPARPSNVVIQTSEAPGEAAMEPATVGRLRRTSPESLSERLRHDLDVVIMKALRKEPAQRYRSALELANDLSAQRDGRLVLAQGHSQFQRLLATLARYPAATLLSVFVVLLLASGAVTLHARAVVYALAATGLLVFWRAVSSRYFVGFALLSGAVYAAARMGLTNHWMMMDWLASISALAIPWLFGSIVRWLFRERWYGKLLLDASGDRPVWFLWFACFYLLLLCGWGLFDWATNDATGRNIATLMIYFTNALFFLWSSLTRSKLELRQRGIICPDFFRSWDQAAAWDWESAAILRVTFNKPLLFQRFARLPVPPSKVDAVETVLRRYLGESQPQNLEPPQATKMSPRAVYATLAGILLLCLSFYAASRETELEKLLSRLPDIAWLVRPGVMRNAADGLDYVWIAPGSFLMGCSHGDDQCSANELPAHPVTISQGFWIGTTPVTNAAYSRFLEARFHGKAPRLRENPNLPHVMITWGAAKQYCEWIGLGLPTEAEWEYAARAGTNGPRYGLLSAIAARQGTHPPAEWDPYPVARKQPNAWGLYDVLGNVTEWVLDGKQDLAGDRVVRGGGNRVSERHYRPPGLQDHVGGFRCAGGSR